MAPKRSRAAAADLETTAQQELKKTPSSMSREDALTVLGVAPSELTALPPLVPLPSCCALAKHC